MIRMLATGVCDDYGLNDVNLRTAFINHVQAISNDVGSTMRFERVALASALTAATTQGALLGRMKGLVTYLSNDVEAGATPDARAQLLSRFNSTFNLGWNNFTAIPRNVAPNFRLMLKDLMIELYDTRTHLTASFVAYRTALAADAYVRMVQLREALLEPVGPVRLSI